MTKADFVDRVTRKTGFSKKDSLDHVEDLFEVMKDTLESGGGSENIRLREFRCKAKSR